MVKRLVMLLFATLFTVMATGIVDAQPPGTPPRPPGPPGWEEYRSTMDEVIRSLEHNRRVLERQNVPDIEGHRAKAIAQIDHALAELRRALNPGRRY
jgi:hypothetical protein